MPRQRRFAVRSRDFRSRDPRLRYATHTSKTIHLCTVDDQHSSSVWLKLTMARASAMRCDAAPLLRLVLLQLPNTYQCQTRPTSICAIYLILTTISAHTIFFHNVQLFSTELYMWTFQQQSAGDWRFVDFTSYYLLFGFKHVSTVAVVWWLNTASLETDPQVCVSRH